MGAVSRNRSPGHPAPGLSQLRQRVLPSKLGLARKPGHVIRLLEQVSRPWTQQAAPAGSGAFPPPEQRGSQRDSEAMHYFVSRQGILPTGSGEDLFRGEFDALFTFRDRSTLRHRCRSASKSISPVDDRDVINHSANGFRLARSAAGQKVGHDQLLALCPPDGENFILAVSCWLMQEQSGGLVTGVQVPRTARGLPAPRGDRHRNLTFRAFLLPPVAAIGEPVSLVVPAGTCFGESGTGCPGRQGHWRAVMKKLVTRAGISSGDFEIV